MTLRKIKQNVAGGFGLSDIEKNNLFDLSSLLKILLSRSTQ
jgi:hypothetical protein